MIELRNDYLRMVGLEKSPAGRQVLRAIRDDTSYKVAGCEHVPAYVDGLWDGRVRLLTRSRAKDRAHLLPAGLLGVAWPYLKRGFPVRDRRRRPGEVLDLSWIGPAPRDYQEAAARAIVEPYRLNGTAPRGMVNVPIRGGKTLIAGRVIQALGWRTLFVVESEMLLWQTEAALRSYLDPGGSCDWLGVCGAGDWRPSWITVATVQTLLARWKDALPLLDAVDLVFVDEVHHMKADEWRKPVIRADAFGKVGLSATIFEDPSIPQERSAIWLRACTGPVLYRIPIERLIREGHLLQPTVLICKIRHVNAPRSWRYGRTYRDLIACGEERNGLIADFAESAARAGMPTLIDTGRIDQMMRVTEMLEARGVVVETLHGQTPPARRRAIVADFQARRVQVLIGTILGEGVDIPELEVLINAEGGKSRIAVMQRLRNLTVSEGKTRAIVIDFADLGQPHLEEHTAARLDLYIGTRGFRMRLIEPTLRPVTIPEDLLPDGGLGL